MAVDYLRSHQEEFYPQLLNLSLEMLDAGELPANEATPQRVLDILQLPETMAGEECLAALSEALQRRIMVYQPNSATISYGRHYDAVGLPIRLLRRGAHFESVLEWRPRRVEQSTQTEVSLFHCFSNYGICR